MVHPKSPFVNYQLDTLYEEKLDDRTGNIRYSWSQILVYDMIWLEKLAYRQRLCHRKYKNWSTEIHSTIGNLANLRINKNVKCYAIYFIKNHICITSAWPLQYQSYLCKWKWFPLCSLYQCAVFFLGTFYVLDIKAHILRAWKLNQIRFLMFLCFSYPHH